MKLKLYSTYDSKVKAWTLPFFMDVIPGTDTTEVLAAWSSVANDPSTKFGQHPEDYCLFEIGGFDSVSGKLDVLPSPISIGLAIHFKQQSLDSIFVDHHNKLEDVIISFNSQKDA